ncbi:NACHT domain-containing protein [Nonomuraea muscovyensis]
MTETLSYADALKILGCNENRLVKAAEFAANATRTGWALAGGARMAFTLADLRDDAVRYGEHVLRRAPGWKGDVNRHTRTQRLAAAHAVVVVSAYLEALDEAKLPFALSRLGLDRGEQAALALGGPAAGGFARLAEALLARRLPAPAPHRPYAETRQAVAAVHREMSQALARYVRGTAVWEGLSPDDQVRLPALLAEGPPARALRIYDEDYRLLAAAGPELAVWSLGPSAGEGATGQAGPGTGRPGNGRPGNGGADRGGIDRGGTDRGGIDRSGIDRGGADRGRAGRGHARADTRAAGVGLSRVARLLAELAPPRVGDHPAVHRVRLAASALDRPLIAAGSVPGGVTLPLLGEGYINPRLRVAEMTREATPAVKSWWEEQTALPDAEEFLVGHLTSPHATRAPLVVLGEPGAGKSKLTEVLAARLASSEFLPIRVELGDVAAGSSVTAQIEQALTALLGERTTFHEVVEAAEGALPVVLLDGLDELVQAAESDRYDYVEQVRAFQRRQAGLGRPVAVIVTCRTVVADRVRFPHGVLAVQLRPFDDDQVRAWLDVWAQANRAPLARHGRRPLPADVALAQGEPARQPLLLLLLALYDAAGNALQRDGSELGRAQLYESLIQDFAARELDRDPAVRALSEARRRRLVERELVRLGSVALSMFVRGRPAVTGDALRRDVSALCGSEAGEEWTGQATGGFLFVDRGEPGGHAFLHATFGDFLVAWLAVYAVRDLVRRQHLAEDELIAVSPQDADDDLLYAVTSFSCLAERGPIVGFSMELLRRLPQEVRVRAANLLAELLRGALHERPRRSFTGFAPVRHPLTRRLAAYSANLVLLIRGVSEEPVSVSTLLRDTPGFERWSSHAHLWKSQLGREGWAGLIRGLPACRVPGDVLLGGAAEPWDFDAAGWWFTDPAGRAPEAEGRAPGSAEQVVWFATRALDERPYLLNRDLDLLTDSLPARDGVVVVARTSGRVVTLTRLVEELLMSGSLPVRERVALYLDAIAALTALPASRGRRKLDLLLRALALEGRDLPFEDRARIVAELLRAGVERDVLRPLLESMLFERTDSLTLLTGAGVPEELLREAHPS